MEDVNDINNDKQEDASHDDATVILPSRGQQSAQPPAQPPAVEQEPEPQPEPVFEEKPVEPIYMSSESKIKESIPMDSPSPIIPEIVGSEKNTSKKKLIANELKMRNRDGKRKTSAKRGNRKMNRLFLSTGRQRLEGSLFLL